MTRATDSEEAAVFKGTITVVAGYNPQEYGQGNIEVYGSVFSDTIVENTDGTGVSVEGVLMKDNTVLIDTTDTRAFLVRKAGDTGDILAIDSSTDSVCVNTVVGVSPGCVNVGYNTGSAQLFLERDGGGGGLEAFVDASHHAVFQNAQNVTLDSVSGKVLVVTGGVTVVDCDDTFVTIGTQLHATATARFDSFTDRLDMPIPSNPSAGFTRMYTDTSDALFKSITVAGVVTTYQPTTSKGDLVTHNGTTQVRLAAGADNTVLVADSSVSEGVRWATASGPSNNIKQFIFTEQQTQGTNGGTNVKKAWTQRTLNTSFTYPAGSTDVTLSGSDLVFIAGTYKVKCTSPFMETGTTVTRLWNESTLTTELTSICSFAYKKNSSIVNSDIAGIIVVPSTQTFKVQYYTSDKENSTGLGEASGVQTEKYTQVEITRIA